MAGRSGEFIDWVDSDRAGDHEFASSVESLEAIGAAANLSSADVPSGVSERIEARLFDSSASQQGSGRILQFPDAGDTKLDAAARVRASCPLEDSDSGVAGRRINTFVRPGVRALLAIAAAAVLLAGIGYPATVVVVSRFAVNRVSEVVAAGSDAETLVDGAWRPLQVGAIVAAGQTVATSRQSVVLRLYDTKVRFDGITYGRLDLTSDDPTVKVGQGNVDVLLDPSGAVEVRVDGAVIARHEAGSHYTIERDGVVVDSQGQAPRSGTN